MQKAIDEFHEKEFKGKKLIVERYDKKLNEGKETPFNNLYVKNIPKTWSDDKLKEYFTQFGTLSSVKVELDHKGESKGFGFVCFEESDSAKLCIEKANKLKMDNGEEL